MTWTTLEREAREQYRTRLLTAHHALPRPAPYPEVKHPLASIVHGIVQANHTWTFVQYVTCKLFGPPTSKTSHRAMNDQAIVAMDVLEILREHGYIRREGDMPRAGNWAGANQVYLIERETTPFPRGEPSDLPIAHSFVLDVLQAGHALDEAKLAPILSGVTVIFSTRGMNAYYRVARAILRDLVRLKLAVRTSDGWFYST